MFYKTYKDNIPKYIIDNSQNNLETIGNWRTFSLASSSGTIHANDLPSASWMPIRDQLIQMQSALRGSIHLSLSSFMVQS